LVPIELAVERYLGAVGIGGYQDREVFRERLREKHGPIAEKVAHAISAREEGENVDVYVLKNSTLALSIDVTSQYCNQMYSDFMRWFLRGNFATPKSLLDVGCDNGIVTCFYATVYPEAQVVGVDKCEQGIACARELAGRLHLANVRFEVRDLLSPDGMFPDHSFDLIVSTTVFHEVLEFPEDFAEGTGSSIDPIKTEAADSHAVKIVADLAMLLRDETGIWVSMDRWPDAPSLAWWIRLLNQAGLSMVADRSTLLRFANVDRELQTLPIVVATRNRHPTDGANEPKQFLEIRGGHNDGFLVSGRTYVDGMDAFVKTHLGR
jgi:SAM-dependent methyltransferase